jgi:catechol 2,3-dioxygenase-like lactoylglutathione lyase family enzyme
MSAPCIDHIGIIVRDLEAAIERFSALLGGLAPQRRDLPDVGLQ